MKIIIDRDSVCIGDDFSHQQIIECDENETIESLINKLLQSNFFPIESLKKLTEKWNAKIDNNIILVYFPINNKIKYIIDKTTPVNNIGIKNIYFKATKKTCLPEKSNIKDYLLFILFICLFCLNIAIIIIPIFYFFSIRNNTYDTCLDTGFCKSGIEINTEHGKIKINKQNCIKYKWVWYEEDNVCFLNID